MDQAGLVEVLVEVPIEKTVVVTAASSALDPEALSSTTYIPVCITGYIICTPAKTHKSR
jgi:hypothetical protein